MLTMSIVIGSHGEESGLEFAVLLSDSLVTGVSPPVRFGEVEVNKISYYDPVQKILPDGRGLICFVGNEHAIYTALAKRAAGKLNKHFGILDSSDVSIEDIAETAFVIAKPNKKKRGRHISISALAWDAVKKRHVMRRSSYEVTIPIASDYGAQLQPHRLVVVGAASEERKHELSLGVLDRNPYIRVKDTSGLLRSLLLEYCVAIHSTSRAVCDDKYQLAVCAYTPEGPVSHLLLPKDLGLPLYPYEYLHNFCGRDP